VGYRVVETPGLARLVGAGREPGEDGVDEAGAEAAVEWGAAEQEPVEDRPDQQFVDLPGLGVRAQVAAGDAR
jgi:hypothetical protein